MSTGDTILTALAAGCSASGLTAFFTFPLDFMKTNQQLSNSAALMKYNVSQNIGSINHMMTGSSALVTGSVLKNAARIFSYNWASNFMAIDSLLNKKKTSAPRVVIAGAMSGFMETLWIVPFERIKTTMIQNRLLVAETAGTPANVHIAAGGKLPKQPARTYVSPHAYYSVELATQLRAPKGSLSRFHRHVVDPKDALRAQFNKTPALTLFRTVRQMYALEGVHAFTRGTFITFARQIATSTAWFSTYNATRQLIDPHGKLAEPRWFSLNVGAAQQLLLHIVSAVAVVAVTQPLDVVKSHMQLKNAPLLYRDLLSTAFKLVSKHGVTLLFAGSLPRGFKIAVHGTLTALLYSYFDAGITAMSETSVFAE